MPEIGLAKTERTIAPILVQTYGDNATTYALALHLAEKIDSYAGEDDDRGGRERMICGVCWDWMTGGSTAEAVAREIEEALASGQVEGPADA
jgi:hypothetical protein